MKIGIVTIIDNNNYGNRLQNYALQKVLERHGKVVTIKNDIRSNGSPFEIKRILKRLKTWLRIIYYTSPQRRKNFREFNKNINFTKTVKYYTHLNKMSMDKFVVGSDQVWNPRFGRLSNIDLLVGVDSIKRVSYAASFGINELPLELVHQTAKELNEFPYLSVREDTGKDIIKKILNRNDVKVHVDPTMLLTREEWESLMKKPKILKSEKYILNYFLGELSNDKKREIARVAKENGCEIINILDKNSPFYKCGPSEFLWLENNAFLICTDSFHSSVFAILFNRPFLVFAREQSGIANMNSRIATLLNKFGLNDRNFTGIITEKDLTVNYSEALKILNNERRNSIDYIQKALK